MKDATLIPGTRWFEGGEFRVKLPEKHCLFCRHNVDFFYDYDGPYLFMCEERNECLFAGKANDDGSCEQFEDIDAER